MAKQLDLVPEYNFHIVKSNKLIEQGRMKFSLFQHRIMLLMMASLKQGANTFEWMELPLTKIVGKARPSQKDYEHLKEASKEMAELMVEIRNPNDKHEWQKLPLLTVKGHDKKNFIQVKFVEDVRPFFLNLQKEYTKYLFRAVSKFRSPHSLRIYELCKQYWSFKSSRKFSVTELKELLYIPDKYQRFSDFKRDVLERTKKEINATSDILLDYQVIRSGQTPQYVIFEFTPNPSFRDNLETKIIKPKATKSKVSPTQDIENEVSKSNNSIRLIKPDVLQKLREKYEEDYLLFVIKKIEEKESIDNITGYLIKALKGDYFLKDFEFLKENKIKQEQKLELVQHQKDYEDLKTKVEKEYNTFLNKLKKKMIKESSDNDLEEYLFYLELESNPVMKKYLSEWIAQKPSVTAKGFYGSWLIQQKHDSDTIESFDIKNWAKEKYDFEFKQ